MILDWIFRIIRHNKLLSADAHNVVVSIGKAKSLYKELVMAAHPVRHPENKAVAEDITKLLNEYRRDYGMLLQLKQRIENEL